ncbi:MAG: hypothetical protein V1778_02500 [bacterium]
MPRTAFIQFHQLPHDLKRLVTSPQAMQQIDALETKYQTALAEVIVQLMVKEVPLAGLSASLQKTASLPAEKAESLSRELREGLLRPVIPYLEGASQVVPRISAEPTTKLPQPPSASPSSLPVPQMPKPTPPLPRVALSAAAPARPAFLPPNGMPGTGSSRISPRPPNAVTHLPHPQYNKVVTGAATYFVSAEDEEEIARHRDRLERVGGASPTENVDRNIDTIIASHKLTFGDDVQEKRFRSILLSRLRDVRTSDEFRELLTRSAKIGGMGYAASDAENILADADAVARMIHDRTRAGHLANPQPVAVPPQTPSVSLPSSRPQMSQPMPPPRVAPLAPQPMVRPAQQPPIVRPPLPPSPPLAVPIPPPVRPPMRRYAAPPVGRRVIQDVRQPERPTGPAQELGALTVDDFRRLGRTLQETQQKIVDKVQLLTDESFDRRAEGVAAWRRSEVHQLYLAMGRESMMGNISIEEVVGNRKRQNLAYLTAQEFSAVADLNRLLMI